MIIQYVFLVAFCHTRSSVMTFFIRGGFQALPVFLSISGTGFYDGGERSYI